MGRLGGERNKKMKTKIKNFDDVLNYHGITAEEFAKRTEGLTPDTVAYEQLKLIVSAYNENVKLDFSNYDQVKYDPWFRYSASGGFSCNDYAYGWTTSLVGSRLCFLDLDNLKDAVEKFKDVYNQYLG